MTGGAVPKEFDPGGRDPKALSARKIGNPLLSGYLQNLTASQTNSVVVRISVRFVVVVVFA